ncbi:MAG: hypothetical protein EXX96DRAFT_546641 [Benjaminiella poitrasii]|nr:MAG: hypothetical protein EXX96DRAFT_546641 [Benjaminiella poitrasii]
MYQNPLMTEPKCCGCMPLRFGSTLICIIWAAFSMYMAILSFQNSSLFFSYMSSAPITVYGVVNLILSLVSMGGIAIIITNVNRYVRTFSHAIFVSVFIVLVDAFVNIILFITYQTNFRNDCVRDSSHSIIQNVNNTLNGTMPSFDFTQDYYNCQNLWQDELKFGIIFYVLMFAFYVYWAFCIYSFSLLRRGYVTDADIRAGDGAGALGVPPVPLPPPNVMMTNAGAPGGVPFKPNDQVIILNNAKPSRTKSTKTAEPKRRIDTFSFRKLKKNIVGTQSGQHLYVPFRGYDDMNRRDSQFTIGFRLGPDGNIIDIEDAPPSPTPTFINQHHQQQSNLPSTLIDPRNQSSNNKQQQLKRKPVKEDQLDFKETYY